MVDKIVTPHLLNGANLSYLGDAYYELNIRTYLIGLGITKGKVLQNMATKYVSAHAHHLIMQILKDELSEEELEIFRRGRNAPLKSHRKNINLQEYGTSCGFEALIGYLYVTKNNNRLAHIINRAIVIINNSEEFHVNTR